MRQKHIPMVFNDELIYNVTFTTLDNGVKVKNTEKICGHEQELS